MKRLLLISLSILIAASARGADAEKKPVDAAAELTALSGTWVMAASEDDGQKMPAEDLKKLDIRLTLKDGKYAVQTAGETTEQGAFTIDAAQKLKAVDIVPADGPMKDRKIQAIYVRDGEKLMLCYDLSGKTRPSDFSAKAGSGFFLAVYSKAN